MTRLGWEPSMTHEQTGRSSDAALAEFRRVLAPDGRLLGGVVNMRTATMSVAASAIAARLGEPAHWTTRAEMKRLGARRESRRKELLR